MLVSGKICYWSRNYPVFPYLTRWRHGRFEFMATDGTPSPAEPVAKSGPSLAAAAAGAATLATIVSFGYLFSVWGSSSNISALDTLRLASAQYVSGNLVVAGELASSVTLPSSNEDEEPAEGEEPEPVESDEDGEPEEDSQESWVVLQDFLIGAGLYEKSTKEVLPADRRDVLEKAIPALEKSRDAGFPEGRSAAGHRMLGLSYYEMGQYDEATESLDRAIKGDLTYRTELTPVLATARARRPINELGQAITEIDQVLALESLDTQKRTETELLKIKWLIELGRFDEAKKMIEAARERIQPEVGLQKGWALKANDELAITDAQMTVRKTLLALRPIPGDIVVAGVPTSAPKQITAAQRTELINLLKVLGEMQREADPKLAAQAQIIGAHAMLLAGERDLALAELTLVRQQRPFRDEGLEGGMSEMELLADMGLGDEVLQTATYLSREIAQSRHLNFTKRREEEFRSRVRSILERLRGLEEYEATIAIADTVAGLFGKAESEIEKGAAYRDWGESILKAGRDAVGDVSRPSFEAARAKFRGAGDAFGFAAEEQFNTDAYVPTLWSAIDAYQRGRHFSKSAILLKRYLRYEDRMRQPRGLVAHGRALLAEGKPIDAMKSLETCIAEFPRDPMRYEARLLAAQAAADAKDGETAKAFLEANLNDGQLTPQSPIWRDSLYTLGELLYAESDLAILQAMEMELDERIEKLDDTDPMLNEALRRLNEAVERYWPSPRAQASAYLLARGQLLAAKHPEAEVLSDSLLEPAKRDLRQKVSRYRQAGLDQFSALVRFMDVREREVDLSEKQKAILRNSLLGQADTLKAMARYTEAADAYREMSLRYMNEPPALEALLGQARMVRLLGREKEANLIVSQAAVVLNRISDEWDEQFEEMTRFDRPGWKKYLDWMTSRFDQATGPRSALQR
ncbi:hypothetical protein SAMN06265222_107162 [Neorhodopirellula lusitana]|uniref:Tetratricopeptide repeat protein n=2 Tax=Neorhodopirellula lusitana TaxID=445327 RepID=A0ABY1Q7F9_9BACT|nr:hypothetical protein SAMN06265222_107162 [Neorhodopirellula lusitana]